MLKMTKRIAFIQKWALGAIVLCSSLLWGSNENQWLGQILTDAIVAKQYAYENRRPLLVEVGYSGCAHCENFYNRIFNTTAFKQFASENRIVLLSMQNKSDASATYRAFKNDFIYTGNVFPFLMMFHVLDEANLNSKTLDKTQVELCTMTWDASGRKTALKYPDVSATVLGVPMSPEASWNPTDCIALVEKFFPNDIWESITPVPEHEGYEGAMDLGRIWDDDHIPMRNGAYYDADWTQRYNASAKTGTNPVFWFKFIGHQGVRYFFETQNPKLSSSQNVTFTAEMFDSFDGKPVSPALGSVTSTNFDTLANGFWFDAPVGSATDQLYYLRIQGKGGSTDGSASFTLRYHEEPSAPEAGSINNPHWTGATLGHWTMDLDAALAAAREDGKPVLLYFVAVHWCPHCLGWEHLAFPTEAFAQRTANYYLVVMDNRRRNGSGPALMMDTQAGGYRETWAISDEEAASKLAETRTIEVALSRGKSPTVDYPDGRITYPSFVVTRAITGQGALYEGLEVVARANGVWTGEEDVNTYFDQFDALFAANYTEPADPEEEEPVIYPRMENSERFVGRYHLAYRTEDDIDGITRGWTILDVKANGSVDYEVQMYDDSQAAGTAFLTKDPDENKAHLALFADLGDGRYLNASLILLADAIVVDGGAAVIEGAVGTAWFDGEMEHGLLATGVRYDPSRTLAEVAGENSFTFLVEAPDESEAPAFVPNILAHEDGNTVVASGSSFLSTQLKSFQINLEQGVFTGSFHIWKGEGDLEDVAVTFQGILTPIAEECCGITDAVAVAYGFYTYEGRNYAMRLLPGSYGEATQPKCELVAREGNNITWNVLSTGGRILCKRLIDGAMLGFAWDSHESLEVVLDGTSPYDIVALDEFCVESETVRLDLQCGEEMTVYPVAPTPGWNIIAIPWDVLLAENQRPDLTCFTLDPVSRCYVRASSLERGRAYWVFSPDGNAKLTFTAVPYPARPELDITTLANGWQMLAWDNALLQASPNVFRWNGTAYAVDTAPEQDHPVMLLLENASD